MWVAWLERRKLNPRTSSPTANSVTPGPTRGHDTGEVAALAGRKRRGKHVMHRPDSDTGLAGVDPGGANLDDHLAGAGRRHIDVRHI